MHTHSPSRLQGPISKGRSWWKFSAPPPARPEPVAIRRQLIERVRREIAAGTYDTPDKFLAALERMLADLDDE